MLHSDGSHNTCEASDCSITLDGTRCGTSVLYHRLSAEKGEDRGGLRHTQDELRVRGLVAIHTDQPTQRVGRQGSTGTGARLDDQRNRGSKLVFYIGMD